MSCLVAPRRLADVILVGLPLALCPQVSVSQTATPDPAPTWYLYEALGDGTYRRHIYRRSEIGPANRLKDSTLSSHKMIFFSTGATEDVDRYIRSQLPSASPPTPPPPPPPSTRPPSSGPSQPAPAPSQAPQSSSLSSWWSWLVTVISSLLALIRQHLWDILKAIITGGALIAIGRWLYGGYRNRTMHLILAGDGSSGKTMLWYALDDKSSKSDKPTEDIDSRRLDAIDVHNKGISYVPRVVDTAGKKQEQAIQEVTRRGFIDRVLRYRTKYILVYVVAPISGEEGEVDHAYVREQLGAMRLFLRLLMNLEAFANKGPQGALLFINKADALQSPDSRQVEQQTDEFLDQLFSLHAGAFADILKTVPYRIIKGSAKRAWRTDRIANLLTNELIHRRK